jgi:PIN domain nuclease of toxin-antitoxin system
VSDLNVLDASALLAYLQGEKGEDVVEAVLDSGQAWVTTVNYCEVASKLCQGGMPTDEAREVIDNLRLAVASFDLDLAVIAADLRVRTQKIGASLGDRACLAFAEQKRRLKTRPVVYTTESSWKKLDWEFEIKLIRPARGETP